MLLGCFLLSFFYSLLSSNMSYLVLYWIKRTDGDGHSVTRTELQDAALRVIIHTRLGRPIPRATADLGCPVLIPSADHLDVQNGRCIWPRGFPDLVCSFFKLNGGSWANKSGKQEQVGKVQKIPTPMKKTLAMIRGSFPQVRTQRQNSLQLWKSISIYP